MIKLTDDDVEILGRPNFGCSSIARLLTKGGVYEDRGQKSEYEQAVCIHWLRNLQDIFGDNWRTQAAHEIERLNMPGEAKYRAERES